MMNIIAKVNSIKDFEKLTNLSSAMILGTEMSLRPAKVFSIDEISDITNKKGKCKIYIEIDKIFHEGDLEQLKAFINKIIYLSIDGIIYSDLGVLNILSNIKHNFELIYDPVTYLTSSRQVNFYKNYGVDNFVLSRELTLQEIKKISLNTEVDNLWVQGYGLTQMLHSKRKLISNFEKFENFNFNTKIQLDKENTKLYDEERNQSYPIFEYKDETFIMSPATLNVFSEYKKLKKYGIKNFIIDFTLQNNDQCVIIESILNYANNFNNESLSYISNNSLNGTSLGLLYKKTMYKI